MSKRKNQAEEASTAVQDNGGDEIRSWQPGDPLAGDGAAETKIKEPKDVRFRRLANKRVPKALKAVQNVAMLFNRAQYEWTDEEALKVIDALESGLEDIRSLAQGRKSKAAGWNL